jgi:RNA polymerase sigma factor (sigma-70 family)
VDAQQLASQNDRLAWKLAWQWRGYAGARGVEFEDLVQAARLGLFIACTKFDHGRGNKLSGYAYPWIERLIRSEIDTRNPKGFKLGSVANDRRQGRSVMVPVTVSIHDTVPGSSITNLDRIPDQSTDPADVAAIRSEIRELVMSLHDERLSAILAMRFGLDGDEMTLKEIGDVVGLSRKRVRQVVNEGIAILRNRLGVKRAAA